MAGDTTFSFLLGLPVVFLGGHEGIFFSVYSAQINWYVGSQRNPRVIGSGSTLLELIFKKPRHFLPV